MREAQWELYASSKALDDIPEKVEEDCKGLIEDIYKRINQASMEAIPMKQWSLFYPNPWWSNEVKESKMKRERLYQEYRRIRMNETDCMEEIMSAAQETAQKS